MKPSSFEYVAPTDLDEALAALADGQGSARPLAGGQSLVPMLNFRLAVPERLVDLNRIRALRIVDVDDQGLRIGAMTRQRELERDPRIVQGAPLLTEAAPHIAHVQIRARGTVGGSVAHADPAAELPALLLVLGASATIARRGREGETETRVERSVPLEELFLGPFFTTLEHDELLTEIRVPPIAARESSAFEELARRRGDYAIVGVAARVRLDPTGICEDGAISLINAGPTPCLMTEAAAALIGQPPTDEAARHAAEVAAATAQPSADMHGSEAYRRHLVRVLTHRVLVRAAGRARERLS